MTAKKKAIMFIDIVGSTRIFQTRGDARAAESIQGVTRWICDQVKERSGTVANTLGDGVLCTFSDINVALEIAWSACQKFAHTDTNIRVGLHHAEAVERNGELLGIGVTIASRAQAKANPGEILLTKAAVDGLSDHLHIYTQPLGAIELKGCNSPVALFKYDPASGTVPNVIETNGPPYVQRTLALKYMNDITTLSSTQDTLSIGRHADCKITLKPHAKLASSRHACISISGGEFMIADTSTNGTYIYESGKPGRSVHRNSTGLTNRGYLLFGTDDTNDGLHYRMDYAISLKIASGG